MKDNASSSQRHQMLFHGTGGDYFAVWIANLILTILTLGIYYAWATVRTRRYFYGNTEIAGDRFDYHARPIDILIGRFMVVAGLIFFAFLSVTAPGTEIILLLLFLIAIPWLIIRSWRYDAIMTSFRGVRFNYQCRTGRAYWVMLLAPVLMYIGVYVLLILFVLMISSTHNVGVQLIGGLLVFLLVFVGFVAINGVLTAMRTELYANNMSYGLKPFEAALDKKAFIKIGLIGSLIMLPFIIVAGFLISAIIFSFSAHSVLLTEDPDYILHAILPHAMSLFMSILVLCFGGVFV
ncbi:MAG: Inner membrane protein YjgN [Candidatus Erwinia impunctatus]|nr:Inner membrane protein YjgN [Culicoides impunctatus]